MLCLTRVGYVLVYLELVVGGHVDWTLFCVAYVACVLVLYFGFGTCFGFVGVASVVLCFVVIGAVVCAVCGVCAFDCDFCDFLCGSGCVTCATLHIFLSCDCWWVLLGRFAWWW